MSFKGGKLMESKDIKVLEEFYSLTDFEGVTKEYVGEIQAKVFQEYKGLYGKE